MLLVADVDPDERPEDPDEFYDHQLVGLRGRDRRRRRRSASSPRCCTCPAQDVLVGTHAPTAREVLVPFVAEIVPEVDLAAGRVVVDPPPGLLDDADEHRTTAERRLSVVRIDVVTIFPDYLAPLRLSLHRPGRRRRAARPARARPARLDRPTGTARSTTPRTAAAPGMVMRPEPWGEALDAVLGAAPTPTSGARRPHAQRAAVHPGAGARSWPREPRLVFACGRYEGIDPRVLDDAGRPGARRARSRLGDYVLDGGEVAVLAIVEAVARLLPGVLGNAESLVRRVARRRAARGPGLHQAARSGAAATVPDVLLSGDHAADRPLAARRGAAPYRRPPPGPARRARPGRARPRRPRRCSPSSAGLSRTVRTVGCDWSAPHRLWQTDRLLSPADRAPCHRGSASPARAEPTPRQLHVHRHRG